MRLETVMPSSRKGSRLVSLFFFFLVACQSLAAGENSLKPLVRSFFGEISQALIQNPTEPLPAGMELISFQGCTGVRLDPRKFIVTPDVWAEEGGLLRRCTDLRERGAKVIAGINGAFYTKGGVLGPVIVNGKVPGTVTQIISKVPKCFLATMIGKSGRKCVMGETSLNAHDLCLTRFSPKNYLNRPVAEDDHLEGLLGGGGWIIRNGRDVHMEAYQRQNFRFRRVDQDSRHSVIAMDGEDRLYLLIFETGANLDRISNLLRQRPEFSYITDAMFLDGGSSSTLVVQGQYLVPPLYLVDKARFSALLIKAKDQN